jgi:hypothetical protein
MITEEQIEAFKKITKAVSVSRSMRKLGEYSTYIIDFKSDVKWLKQRRSIVEPDDIIRGTYINETGRMMYGWTTTIEEDEMIQILRNHRLEKLGI